MKGSPQPASHYTRKNILENVVMCTVSIYFHCPHAEVFIIV